MKWIDSGNRSIERLKEEGIGKGREEAGRGLREEERGYRSDRKKQVDLIISKYGLN